MNRRLLWSSILLGLLLKWIGASWDVASHFRTTQDSANPAHLINLAGNIILVLGMAAHWFRRLPEEQRPMLAFFAGMGIVGVAVPLDLAWHKVFGLDLTTWSPTHMLLFYGTAVASAALAWLLLVHLGWSWRNATAVPRLGLLHCALLALLLARTLAPLLFPASFNEFAVVGAENLRTGQSIYRVDSTLVDFAAKFHDLPYADLPHALYPAYTLAVAGAFLVAVRRMSGMPGLATAVAAIYGAGRVLPDLAMHALGFPISAVPYHVLFVGAAVDLAWSRPVRWWLHATAAATMGTSLSYAFWALPTDWPWRVPLDWATAPWALAAAVAGCLLAASLPPEPFLAAGRRLERLVPRWLLRRTLRGTADPSPS